MGLGKEKWKVRTSLKRKSECVRERERERERGGKRDRRERMTDR